MRAQKRDDNEREIIDALEAVGASVDPLPGGNGRPDLLVGYRGVNYLIEVKGIGEGFKPLQRRWHMKWFGKAHVAFGAETALLIIGAKVTRIGRYPVIEAS